MLRALLLIGLAWPAAAQSAPTDLDQAARDLVANAAQSLAARRTAGFLEALEKPLAERLRKPIETLLRSYDLQPALAFVSAKADESGVALDIDWKMDLAAREGLRSITHRQRRVICRVESRDGALRVVTFDEAPGAPGLFTLPDVNGAWNLLQSAARSLTQRTSPTAGFLTAFDSSLPGYESLRSGAESLTAQGEVDSTIGLTADEGTDTARTLDVDWTLEVVNAETGLSILQRESELTVKIERSGKIWRIVSLTPLDFFTK